MPWPKLFRLFQRQESPPGYDELNDRLDRLERNEKLLELEWENVYNKLRALLARLNKREERAAEAYPENYPRQPEPNGGDDIDRQIALRRGRGR